MIYYDRFNSYYTESYIDQDMTTGASDYNDDSFDDEDDIYNESVLNDIKNEYVDTNILDKISLRPATISDVDMMTDMEFDSILDGYPRDLSDDELVNIKRSVKQDAKESVWKTRMIMFKNKTIGMLTAYELKGYWYIGELYILEEYRGNGIGTMLLKNEINAHDRLSLNVYKRNIRAIRLYKSLGFVVSIETETTLFMTLTKDKIK